MSRIPAWLVLLVIAGLTETGNCQREAIWNLESLKQVPEMRWIDATSPVRSLVYQNEPYEGHVSEVFAYYATPGTICGDTSRDQNLPAVVLLHGGGGTAFAEWAELWAKRGYAAIAMDLCGGRPVTPEFDPETRQVTNAAQSRRAKERLLNGGPAGGAENKFQTVGGDLTDDWQYHAVAAAMRAHSLIRSFPEVDANRTAVTGISWGGYLTCLVASIDDRFQAAVPVYGCGFIYDGESVQKRQVDSLDEKKRAEWIRIWDPSAWLPKCRVPIFFVNGTNDVHYPLNSYVRSYDLVPGPKQIRIQPGMRHSHVHGWAPAEIGMFIDHYLRDAPPLPSIRIHEVTGDIIKATVASTLPLEQVLLHFTTDRGLLSERKWQQAEARLDGQQITATRPEEATVWLITVTDSRGAMVSTRPTLAVE
jgi:cephalosporin-C deacetylase-like acetyl esterase